ncbi:GNAT family N-acetyltransferase [Parasphingorhabdus sp.]|uniref:GNAT family N-acetyltransferase n=1 Tax=Parasphingorhabdus sp. TaxID=2709688 RepID=UPI003BB071F9
MWQRLGQARLFLSDSQFGTCPCHHGGGIALPNDTSIALHETLGFQKVAHFKEVGRKFERWIDVGYWQLLPGDQVNAEPGFIR